MNATAKEIGQLIEAADEVEHGKTARKMLKELIQLNSENDKLVHKNYELLLEVRACESEIERLKAELEEQSSTGKIRRMLIDNLRDENARLRRALNDAIRKPMGVVPDSAVDFYEPTE